MNLTLQAKHFVVAITVGLTTLAPTWAQNMVSIKGSSVNMRASPSIQSDVLWELEKGYPLKVIKRHGQWLQVQDFENDRRWVVGRAESMELLRTLGKKPSWIQVQRATGETGWISKNLLWGW